MMNSSNTALFTANRDVAVSFLNEVKKLTEWKLIYLPLENYAYSINLKEEAAISDKLNSFSFIIHGNLRNARYFIQWATEKNRINQVQKIVHVAPNQSTVDFLAEYDIPGVMPREDARPVDVLEFMLRISREGTVLYPTTDQKNEEIPGLLQELEMPVVEFQVCKEETLDSKTLITYREKIQTMDPDWVIFHSRSSITRIRTAFPNIDLTSKGCISSGQVVSQKLNEVNINPRMEAKGSWHSLLDVLS